MEEHQYPSIKEQAKNLTSLAKDVASDLFSGQSIFVPKDVQEYRLSVCKTCDWHDEQQGRCKNCGCILSHKLPIAAAYCPIFKWNKYTNESPGTT